VTVHQDGYSKDRARGIGPDQHPSTLKKRRPGGDANSRDARQRLATLTGSQPVGSRMAAGPRPRKRLSGVCPEQPPRKGYPWVRKPMVTLVARALVGSMSLRVKGRRVGAQVALSAKVEESLAVVSYLTGTADQGRCPEVDGEGDNRNAELDGVQTIPVVAPARVRWLEMGRISPRRLAARTP